jgi:hypothetical protein
MAVTLVIFVIGLANLRLRATQTNNNVNNSAAAL